MFAGNTNTEQIQYLKSVSIHPDPETDAKEKRVGNVLVLLSVMMPVVRF
jgi:hypothetical protein